jgi:hypothetical protein
MLAYEIRKGIFDEIIDGKDAVKSNAVTAYISHTSQS